MEETRRGEGSWKPELSNSRSCSSIFVEVQPALIVSQGENLNIRESKPKSEQNELSAKTASEVLWATGSFAGMIPNGFYSVVPGKQLKELFHSIPSLDELNSLGMEGVKADIILVDAEKDKKLLKLKQLILAMVKGLKSNPALMIKKIAGLVSDCYRHQNSESSPAKAAHEESGYISETRVIQLLAQIKHGSCRPRAILFKVLADAVGLQSKIIVGLPSGVAEYADSYKHMSVVVVLNNVELLVDLMRFPGQLIPSSTKAIVMCHVFARGESDSADNESCDSPLEPNSPLCVISDKLDGECPEYSFLGTHGPSILGDRRSFHQHTDDTVVSRSVSGLASNARRSRQRSISITPEVDDDIFRAVRAMNETLKQKCLLTEQRADGSCSYFADDLKKHADSLKNVSNIHRGSCDVSCERSSNCNDSRIQAILSQKAISLPSSPNEFRDHTCDRNRNADSQRIDDSISTWNKVLESSSFLNKPLLPFQEWNIDFSELSVGTRVGIGFFGEVFRGVWNGTDVAIKIFLEQDLTAENMEDFCNEITILSRLRHPNVILFLGACTRPPRLSMVTEYMELGSLYYLMHMSGQKKKLSWRRRLKMLRDICRGLMCLHRMKIIHRDLKSANCLVNKHWTVKICDFGLSKVMTDVPMRDSSSAGTPEWMAPELIRNEPFTEKSDVFSFGVIMWELCTLNRPWEGIPPVQVIYSVANEGTRLEIPEGPLGKLISVCWAEPDERPNCEEIFSRLLDCEYNLR